MYHKVKKVKGRCSQCGKPKIVTIGRIKWNIFCSAECKRRFHLVAPHPIKCVLCKKMFNIVKPRKICFDCIKTYFTRPSGGKIEGMDYTREMARIRDKHTCKKCGKKWKHGTRRFDVHHTKGVCGKKSRSYDNSIKNLITLCHKCHLNLREVKTKMTNRSSPRPKRDKDYYKIYFKRNRKRIYASRMAWRKKQTSLL